VFAQGARSKLQLLGLDGIAGLTQQPDLFRHVVHLSANGIALGDDLAGSLITGDGLVELIENLGTPPSSHRRANELGLVAEETDVDHRAVRLLPVTC
jgi:hypothetical protein